MKRKSMLKMITATLALSVVGGATALLAQDNVTASAATTFAMDTVAAVRIPDAEVQGDVSGIRFYVHMDEATRNEAQTNGYGFLVFPKRYLSRVTTGEYHAELDDNNAETKDYIKIDGDKKKFYDDDGDGLWTAQAVIAPVSAVNYNEPFTCVAYINDGNGGYKYATIDNTFSRNVLQVASAAYIAEPQNRSALVSAYALGTTNPVQIADGEDLDLISEQVAGGTTFEGVSFKLANNITLADGFEPIAETFAGTIDTNGVEISGNFSTTLVKDETVLTGDPVTENVTSTDTFVEVLPFAGSFSYQAQFKANPAAVYQGDYINSYKSAAQMAALENPISGDYQGAAIETKSVKNEQPWYARVNYSDEQIQGFGDKYSHIQFYLAVAPKDGIAQDWSITLGNYLLQYAEEVVDTNKQFTFNKDNANKWISFTIPVKALETAKIDTPTDWGAVGSVALFNYPNARNEADNIGSYVNYYVSDLKFVYKKYDDSAILRISAETLDDVFNNNGYTTKENTVITPADFANLGLSNNYAGNAVKFTQAHANTNGSFNFNMPMISERQIKDLKTTYNHVRMWIAVTASSACTIGNTNTQASLVRKAHYALNQSADTGGTVTFDKTGRWVPYLLDIDTFFEVVKGDAVMSLATQATEDVNGVKGYKFTADNDLKWTEFTVPMETFVDYVNGNVACDLFKRLECNGQNFYLYLSAFEFVNVAS